MKKIGNRSKVIQRNLYDLYENGHNEDEIEVRHIRIFNVAGQIVHHGDINDGLLIMFTN